MTSDRWWRVLIGAAVVLFLVALCSCSDEDKPTEPTPTPSGSSCVNCHTDAERLEQLAVESPPPSGDPGEG